VADGLWGRTAEPGTLTIRAGRLIDGTGSEPRRDVVLTVESGVITRVQQAGDAPRDGDVLDLGDYTVLPGLINMHVHSVLPGDGTPFEQWMEHPDETLLLTAHANALASLRSGVTTLRDCGGKGSLMFRLRDAIRAGVVPGPRYILSGRPLTITGGHCRYFGGEADGVEGMRLAARQVLKEGADFVKIMASGGGTVGTYSQFPTYEVEELRAAIAEAHKIGKPAACHAIATESVARALEAGTDHIEHCSFMAPDKSWMFDDQLAQRVAQRAVFVTATLQVGADPVQAAEEHEAQGIATREEQILLESAPQARANRTENIRRLHELGVPVVAGSDAGWRHTGFDDFYEELIYLQDAGLTPLEAIHSATGLAAKACRIDATVGTIAGGKVADLIAVAGDPASDLRALKDPALVIQAGRVVVDRR
jgi:imidazolonepropionase-like amidohydrolase